MDMSALESFLAVLDTGTVTEGARRRFVSQPALSRQIHALEATCRTPLFTRSKGGMIPTRAGRQLEPVARDLLARTRSAERVMAALGEQEIPLTLACPIMVAEALILPFVAECKAAVANVIEEPTRHIFDRIMDLSADLAIAPITPPPQMKARRIFQVPFSLQVRADSTLASRDSIDITELPELPLLLPDPMSGTRIALDAHLARAQVILQPYKEVTRTHIAQAMAMSGHGVVVAIDFPKYDLVAIPLLADGERLLVEEWAGWPVDHYAEHTILRFLDEFVAWMKRRTEGTTHIEFADALDA